MSENIPESIPTSMDPRSQRATKKRALSPASQQSAHLATLFKNPDRNIYTGSGRDRKLAPPPEIVANVQGSSAGAGSGEFHVYKASRRREYERLKMMDEEVRLIEEKDEFEKKADEMRRMDEEKTARNRAKRNKKKGKGGVGGVGGVTAVISNGTTTNTGEKEGGAATTTTATNGNGVHLGTAAPGNNETTKEAPASEAVKGVVIFDDD